MRQAARRVRALLALLAGLATAAGTAGLVAAAAGDPQRPGGATTVFSDGRTAFSFPAANLTDEERTRFVIGNSFFRRNWVQAPASTRARDGLGPHFIARSCGGCHVQDGRGPPPLMREGVNAEQPVALLLRLSIPGSAPHGGPLPEPVYGGQFANAAVRGVRREGSVEVRMHPLPGRFEDGTAYELQVPEYRVAALGYGAMHPEVRIGPRIAPQLIGAGLLEAIPESEILANARRQAAAQGRIRGRTNRVWDEFAGRMMTGRFGWKANVATIAHQTGAAFRDDIGITSSRFRSEACTDAQVDCLEAPRGGGQATSAAGLEGAPVEPAPEIDDATFDDVVFYTATLAPPARRHHDDPVVAQGQGVFHAAQCAVCHRPSYTTGESPLAKRFPKFSSPALAGQVIWPYTDLLLHDMGEGLADGRPDFDASGREWRTPPLWGIGLIEAVNGHERLLHDGRARGVLEAVMWHDGEARQSREYVRGLSAADREALVRFVRSL